VILHNCFNLIHFNPGCTVRLLDTGLISELKVTLILLKMKMEIGEIVVETSGHF
jgi:hypothetical protein